MDHNINSSKFSVHTVLDSSIPRNKLNGFNNLKKKFALNIDKNQIAATEENMSSINNARSRFGTENQHIQSLNSEASHPKAFGTKSVNGDVGATCNPCENQEARLKTSDNKTIENEKPNREELFSECGLSDRTLSWEEIESSPYPESCTLLPYNSLPDSSIEAVDVSKSNFLSILETTPNKRVGQSIFLELWRNYLSPFGWRYQASSGPETIILIAPSESDSYVQVMNERTFTVDTIVHFVSRQYPELMEVLESKVTREQGESLIPIDQEVSEKDLVDIDQEGTKPVKQSTSERENNKGNVKNSLHKANSTGQQEAKSAKHKSPTTAKKKGNNNGKKSVPQKERFTRILRTRNGKHKSKPVEINQNPRKRPKRKVPLEKTHTVKTIEDEDIKLEHKDVYLFMTSVKRWRAIPGCTELVYWHYLDKGTKVVRGVPQGVYGKDYVNSNDDLIYLVETDPTLFREFVIWWRQQYEIFSAKDPKGKINFKQWEAALHIWEKETT